jgi:hypothetical protein
MPNAFIVILFRSTSHAIRAEKILQDAGIRSKMIPVPRHLSSDCGVCIRIPKVDREDSQQALCASGFEIEGVYDI